MKKIKSIALLLLISLPILFQSCGTMCYGGFRKNIILADMPKDLKVRYEGQELPIKQRLAFSEGGNHYTVNYLAPGVRLKMKKHMVFEFESNGKVVKVPIERRLAVFPVILESIGALGSLALVPYSGFGGFLFWGGVTGIDFATLGVYRPKESLIDVPAKLNGVKGRDQRALKNSIREQSK